MKTEVTYIVDSAGCLSGRLPHTLTAQAEKFLKIMKNNTFHFGYFVVRLLLQPLDVVVVTLRS